MKPPGEEQSSVDAGSDPPIGTVEAGGYLLRVGDAAGTIVERVGGEGTAEQPRPSVDGPGKPPSAIDAATGAVDDAAAVTAKVERAVALGKGVAEGQAFDPEQLSLEVDSLLGLLERLDRQGRAEEVLRLARALSTVVSLLKRWVALLRALRAALRASEKLGDLDGLAWAKHELGTLHLVTGDVAGAERCLREALATRERLGDRRGMAATSRNTQALCERLRQMLRERKLVQHSSRLPIPQRPLLLACLAAALLLLGGAAGAVLAKGGGSDSSAAGAEEARATNAGGPATLLSLTVVGPGSVSSEPPGIECDAANAAAYVPGDRGTEARLAATGSIREGEIEKPTTEEPTTEEPTTEEPTVEEPTTEEPTTEEPTTEEPGTEDPGVEPTPEEEGEAKGSPTTSCGHRFDAGEAVLLTAEPAASSSVEFSGDCVPQGETECRVTMDQAREVTVVFAEVG